MSTNPIRRATLIRPLLDRRKIQRPSRIHADDLPAIAAAFGISVDQMVDTAKRTAA